jgi:hypothetical protein
MTPEMINELLEAAKPSVIESLKRELTQMVSYEVRSEAAKIVQAETVKWVNENIVPAIIAALVEQKDGMISIGTKLGPALVDEITKGMVTTVSEKLKQSWERKKIWEALLA